ncbi:MAG TPA: hypothetical protein VFB50_01525 [Chloroflexota bacterium]|nr:hypothetical protein [Chloroflexota bacterium]
MTTTADSAARKAYFVWLARHPNEADALRDLDPDVLHRLWLDAWQSGSWDSIRRNTDLGLSLAQIVQRLEELADLYRSADIEREAEQGSALWSSDAPVYEEEALPF